MAFPKPEDYKTHDGPFGSPADWASKAQRVVEKASSDPDIAAALETLGLPEKPNAVELKRAFRQAALTAHPDHGGKPEDFHEIKAALDVLLNDKEIR